MSLRSYPNHISAEEIKLIKIVTLYKKYVSIVIINTKIFGEINEYILFK
jgi:hypothetical protein